MKLIILDTSDDVAEWAAKYVVKRIQDFQPGEEKFFISRFWVCSFTLKQKYFRYFVLGLPTGNYNMPNCKGYLI